MPTGSGKSLVIAQLAHIGRGRVLVVTDRQELLRQNEAKLQGLAPGADTGIYSAGLERREADAKVVFGGIQSIYNRVSELERAGKFTAIIVDEAHKCPEKKAKSMYRTLFESCPGAIRIGLTATPYRLKGGLIYQGDGAWFDDLAYHAGIRDLTEKGWLSRLVGVQTATDVETKGLAKVSGDWSPSALSERYSEPEVVRSAMDEIMVATEGRHHWVVFCVDVKHAELVSKELAMRGVGNRVLVGGSGRDYQMSRKHVLEDFARGRLKALVGCDVFSTGFDIPIIDCVVMLFKTESKMRVVQRMGRGSRLAEGKADCVIVDLGNNIERHAPLDGLEVVTKTPRKANKDKRMALAREVRKERERKARHGIRAFRGDPLGEGSRELRVLSIDSVLTPSKAYPGKSNVMVRYTCVSAAGVREQVTQWLCVEYPSRGAASRARTWFTRRGLVMPQGALAACALARTAPLPRLIRVSTYDGYDRVKEEIFDG